MSRLLSALMLVALSATFSTTDLLADGTRMLRYPDISGDRVTFSYSGDIWLAPLDDSEPARRLTSHPGLELYPKFSPDGKHIAFTGQYRGDEQIYVIDVDGGAPRQLTWYPTAGPLPARWGTDNQVYGWTPDGKYVLFRSNRFSAIDPRLFRVAIDGGLPQALPMPRAGSGDFSPDGKSIFYSPLFRDFRTWKRYQGGWAQNLYVFDLENDTARQLTDNIRTERDPVWLESGMYFVSDRDGTLNLYELKDDGSWRAITHDDTWDIKWASGDGVSRIVYEVQGQIGLYDATTDSTRLLTVHVPDDQVRRIARRIEVKSQVEDFGVSPGGERLLVTARGDVFTVPVEHGITRNLTQRGDAHDRQAAWSPDGKQVAFISDRSGEEQLYVVDQQGGAARQLGELAPARLYHPTWAPDSSAIALYDETGSVYVVDMQGRKTEVFHSRYEAVDDYTWAPDSQWLAFTVRTDAGTAAVRIWSRKDGQLINATDGGQNAYHPAWGADGKHLYFLSDREFAPQIGVFEWNYVANRATGIFALALNKDSGNPFAPRNDEVGDAKKDEAKDDKKDKDKKDAKEEAVKVTIETDGLAGRLIRAPIDADNIAVVVPQKDRLLYETHDAFFYGREGKLKPTLHAFDFEKRESTDIVEDFQDLVPTRDEKYVIVQTKEGFQRVEIEKPKEPAKISLDNLVVYRAPAEEWEVMFDEVWRRYRDYFYVRNMHGYDWQALHDQYKPLVADVSTREDLNTLIGEMIAELNVGHAYIAGGDLQAGPRSTVALLGVRFEADEKSGRYRVSHVYAGNNAEPKYRSPLTEVGSRVSEGDYVLSIDGQELTTTLNPYKLLTDRGSQPVELRVNSKPTTDGARRILADPISSERKLDYLEWVQHNYDYVTKKTDGKVGYLHIPDMGEDGIYEFIKWFYPQLRKQGLVVDVRSNGGGNVSQMILRRLMQKPLGYGYQAHSEWTDPYPHTAFNGPMAALISENSASDGDIFPYFFREAGLGPLIGKRTWGGVVGISGHGPLLDGGTVYVPEYGMGGKNGEWVIEGKGVSPDIEVSNDPTGKGDAQLDRGIQEVMQRIEANPPKFPVKPPEPVKTQ
ncbi:MAG: LpqB family beta-propeller domain-containing protein [Lysobacterales bacterium]|jgi:tricorn protease